LKGIRRAERCVCRSILQVYLFKAFDGAFGVALLQRLGVVIVILKVRVALAASLVRLVILPQSQGERVRG
jgi:hypothetical protein